MLKTMDEPGVGSKIAIRIIAFRGDSGACWFYRLHLPFTTLVRHHPEYGVVISGCMNRDQLGKFDVVILQRQYTPQVLGPTILMKKNGAKIIYEIDDDLFHVPQWNPAYKTFGKHRCTDMVRRFLDVADAVFVSTESLREVFSAYNDDVYVLPNSVSLAAHVPSPCNSARKVVCWQGSPTHAHDLKIIGKAIERLAQDSDTLVKLWSADVPGTYKVPFVDFSGFHQMFAQVDALVGLAPLVPHVFNRAKSNLKFLEYTAQGVAVVASDFGPYAESIIQSRTGFLVSDNRGWYDLVRVLLNDEVLRQKLVSNAQAYLKEHYDIENNYSLWKEALDEVVGLKQKETLSA